MDKLVDLGMALIAGATIVGIVALFSSCTRESNIATDRRKADIAIAEEITRQKQIDASIASSQATKAIADAYNRVSP